jgi:hypothetical protein
MALNTPKQKAICAIQCQEHASPLKCASKQSISRKTLAPLLTVLYRLKTGSSGQEGCQNHRKGLSTKQELGIVHYIKGQAAAARPASPKEVLELANETYVFNLPEAI